MKWPCHSSGRRSTAPVDHLARLLDLALLGVGERGEDVLPRRGLEDDARLRADREHGRVVLCGDRAALRPGPREDERARRRVDLVVAEREGRAAAEDDVHLLVAVLLVVLLDDALARPLAVYAFVPNALIPNCRRIGPPDELAAGFDRQLLELVDRARPRIRSSPCLPQCS